MDMPPWVTLALIGLLIWRALYAVKTARGNRSLISKWTDPWIL
jgi:hypothetical protein